MLTESVSDRAQRIRLRRRERPGAEARGVAEQHRQPEAVLVQRGPRRSGTVVVVFRFTETDTPGFELNTSEKSDMPARS